MKTDDQILAELFRRLLEDRDTAFTISDQIHVNGTVAFIRNSEIEALNRVLEDQL